MSDLNWLMIVVCNLDKNPLQVWSLAEILLGFFLYLPSCIQRLVGLWAPQGPCMLQCLIMSYSSVPSGGISAEMMLSMNSDVI